ncbi:RHS repeat-associated core domain-containing protein, partial [Enterobacter chuandaensis]
ITYAGGTETRQRRMAGTLQLDVVITEGDGVRLVHNRLTGEVHLRYSFSDQLGSCGGEADEQGNITAREEYLPFGASAGSDEEASEVADRTVRYSGKERDATGLLYYGWRYYQPETGRWLSADPGGLIDGVNLFRFCCNNPVTLRDDNGLQIYPILGAFLTDISSGMGISLEAEYQLLDKNTLPQITVPVAVWADRIYITDAEKHMAIRPQEESGFPDFVGTLNSEGVMENNTGHYRTSEKELEYVKNTFGERFTYRKYSSSTPRDSLSGHRMSMLTSPADYIARVKEFRNGPEKAIEFLKEHQLYDAIYKRAQKGEVFYRGFLQRTQGIMKDKTLAELQQEAGQQFRLWDKETLQLRQKWKEALDKFAEQHISEELPAEVPGHLSSFDNFKKYRQQSRKGSSAPSRTGISARTETALSGKGNMKMPGTTSKKSWVSGLFNKFHKK